MEKTKDKYSYLGHYMSKKNLTAGHNVGAPMPYRPPGAGYAPAGAGYRPSGAGPSAPSSAGPQPAQPRPPYTPPAPKPPAAPPIATAGRSTGRAGVQPVPRQPRRPQVAKGRGRRQPAGGGII